MTTHHFLNLTGGDPDGTWTTGDYTTVESAFDTYWGAIKEWFSDKYTLAQYQWRADGPAHRPHGTEFSPTLRTIARTVAGGATNQSLPPQVALSVTEVTPAKYTATDVEGVGDQLRNRWGRYYLPAMTVGVMSNGRPSPTVTADVADATQVFYNTCVAADLIPVMYSPTTGSSWAVSDIHVDDIFDVIRSRRFVTPTTREPRVIDSP